MPDSLLAYKIPIKDVFLPNAPHPETIGQFVTPVINNVLILIGIFALFTIIFAGFNFITAGGDKNKISQASTMLTFAIVGLILAVSAFLITNIIGGLTGFDFFNTKVK